MTEEKNIKGSAWGPLERARRTRWPERLAALQPTFTTQEPLLALRRQLADLMDDSGAANECWLQHAKLCRATGKRIRLSRRCTCVDIRAWV